MSTGKGKLLFFLGFTLLMVLGGLGKSWGAETKEKASPTEKAKVSFVQGRAEVLNPGETAWRLLGVGNILSGGDEVRTAEKSRIEIQLPDQSVLRFDQKTTFKMKAILFNAQEGSRDVKVEVGSGKTWANVRKVFGPKKTFEIASVNAVAGVRDTIWRMNVELDRSTLIRVYEGTVEVYNPFAKPDSKPEEGGFKAPREVKGPQEVPRPYTEVTREQWEEIVVTQMMQVVIPTVGRPETPASFNAEEDQREEWVRWNKRRDQEIRR